MTSLNKCLRMKFSYQFREFTTNLPRSEETWSDTSQPGPTENLLRLRSSLFVLITKISRQLELMPVSFDTNIYTYLCQRNDEKIKK